ncbi:excinuclease ATPase subunit [Duganella sp. FT135W]|uniref:Excinuclease ATPase subunit n=1 Tax=Duganella flavida TaxID=2692175 RepID=A0A6L8KIR5_9BURK|nr:excinuclease ATPase subunit [Duganella flavida]MYM25724.1 excinuclease ATPase subunit [Duganella flavida]
MKKMISVAVLLAVSTSFSAQAADTMLKLPIAGAMSANDAEKRLGDSVKFYFAGQPTPTVLTQIASDKTSQRTNGFGKSAEKACNWVFLSAMLALQNRAHDLGANAVVNIVSNFNNVEMASATEFECADGALMAGVALKGDFVKIAQ